MIYFHRIFLTKNPFNIPLLEMEQNNVDKSNFLPVVVPLKIALFK